MFVTKNANILFIIKPVYRFDLSCYRIIGGKERWVKGLLTVYATATYATHAMKNSLHPLGVS